MVDSILSKVNIYVRKLQTPFENLPGKIDFRFCEKLDEIAESEVRGQEIAESGVLGQQFAEFDGLFGGNHLMQGFGKVNRRIQGFRDRKSLNSGVSGKEILECEGFGRRNRRIRGFR